MLRAENFSEEHIRELQRSSRRDPILIERSVYAFGLLEALRRVGMKFIFKGGTSLMLLLEHPMRLSTDIDIIVPPETNIDHYLDEAGKIFPFREKDEQIRVGKNNIIKRHFKFIYDSPINKAPLYILLDVVFEENPYNEIVSREIRNDILMTEPDFLTVDLPSREDILGDKMTAFAPHTTGIPFDVGKDMEIMKQFYDVSCLLDAISDYEVVGKTFHRVAGNELAYRGLDIPKEKVIEDSFRAALCIASRGRVNEAEYKKYVKGIHDVRNHIFAERYSSEIASHQAPKIMYAMTCLLSGKKYERVEDYTKEAGERFLNRELLSLKYLREANPEGYAYAIKADRIIETTPEIKEKVNLL